MNGISSLLARLFTMGALCLTPLLFFPGVQHAFWSVESISVRLFTYLSLFFSSLSGFPRIWSDKTARVGFWLAFSLFAWLALSSLFSFRRDLSLAAFSEFVSFPALFTAVWILAKDPAQETRVLFAVLFAGIWLSAYGLLQFFGFEFLAYQNGFPERAASFLGNPNFLGGHLALLAPLCLGLFLSFLSRGQGGTKTALTGFLFFLFSFCLLATATRGACLGWLAGVGALLLANRKPCLHIVRRYSLLAGTLALGLVLGTGLFFAARPLYWQRIFTQAPGSESGLSQRRVLFLNSLSLSAEHPLLGVGPGNFRIFYPSVQARDLEPGNIISRPYVYSEHSHNDLLQMAVEAGYPAALLLLGLWFWFFARLWQCLRRQTSKDPASGLVLSGLGAGLLALNVHGLFNFPFLILPTQLSAWALAALALRRMRREERKGSDSPAPSLPLPVPARLALGLVCLLISFCSLRPLGADALWWVGQGLQAEENGSRWEDSKPMLAAALRLSPYEDRLWYRMGLAQSSLGQLPRAAESLARALKLNPFFSEARLRLGKDLLKLDKPAEAEADLAPLQEYAPNYLEMWESLGASRFRQNKFEAALATYDAALRLRPGNQVLLENQAAALGSLWRFDEALAVLDQVLLKNPQSVNARLSKAITYIKMRRLADARREIGAVLKLQPENTAAQDLLKGLKSWKK